MTFVPALILPDSVLFDRELSHAAKVILGATIAFPNRDPSVTQLQAATGLKRQTIVAAQRELDREQDVWFEDEHGELEPATWQLVTYNRPRRWYDRQPDNPRFNRSNRLVKIQDWANPHHRSNDGRRVELPGELVARLPRGTKNAALTRLVAATYAREQLLRQAIQVEDQVVGRRLRCTPAQVRRIRERLIERGVLVRYRKDSPCTIYAMPGATPGRPERPEQLDPSRTRRLHELVIGGCFQSVYASAGEFSEAGRLINRLGDALATLAWISGTDFDPHETEEIGPLLDALKQLDAHPPTIQSLEPDKLPESQETADSGHLPSHFGTRDFYPSPPSSKDVLDVENDEQDQDTSDVQAISAGHARSEAASEEDRVRTAAAGATGRESRHRRVWPDCSNVYAYVTAAEEAEIQALADAVRAKPSLGDVEWRDALRSACLEGGASGPRILAQLRRRFGHLLEAQLDVDSGMAALLDQIGGTDDSC